MAGDNNEFDLTGACSISGHLYGYVDDLFIKAFNSEGDKKGVQQFALAVGIASDSRLPRSEFKAEGEHKEVNPASQLATYDGIEGILTLLSLQGSIGDLQPVKVISEYMNGGLEFLKGISFENQDEDSMAIFLEAFPHLSDEEESD